MQNTKSFEQGSLTQGPSEAPRTQVAQAQSGSEASHGVRRWLHALPVAIGLIAVATTTKADAAPSASQILEADKCIGDSSERANLSEQEKLAEDIYELETLIDGLTPQEAQAAFEFYDHRIDQMGIEREGRRLDAAERMAESEDDKTSRALRGTVSSQKTLHGEKTYDSADYLTDRERQIRNEGKLAGLDKTTMLETWPCDFEKRRTNPLAYIVGRELNEARETGSIPPEKLANLEELYREALPEDENGGYKGQRLWDVLRYILSILEKEKKKCAGACPVIPVPVTKQPTQPKDGEVKEPYDGTPAFSSGTVGLEGLGSFLIANPTLDKGGFVGGQVAVTFAASERVDVGFAAGMCQAIGELDDSIEAGPVGDRRISFCGDVRARIHTLGGVRGYVGVNGTWRGKGPGVKGVVGGEFDLGQHWLLRAEVGLGGVASNVAPQLSTPDVDTSIKGANIEVGVGFARKFGARSQAEREVIRNKRRDRRNKRRGGSVEGEASESVSTSEM